MTQSPTEVLAPVLERVHTAVATHFGEPAVRLVPGTIAERPFSYVVRVDVVRHSDDVRIGRAYAKVFKPHALGSHAAMAERVLHDYETTERVCAALRSQPELGVVPPIACYPDLLAIVTEEVAGPTLLEAFHRGGSWFRRSSEVQELAATVERVGRWIRAFQTTSAPRGIVEVTSFRHYIDHRLQRLVRAAGDAFTEADRADLLEHVDALGRALDARDLTEVPVHSDMSLGNILVPPGRVVVLDFAMAKYGTALHDLTKVYLQIGLLAAKPQFPTGRIAHLQRKLLEGFDPTLTTDHPLFRLTLALHRVNHLTGLFVRRSAPLSVVHDHIVRRQHRQWISRELDRGVAAAGARS